MGKRKVFTKTCLDIPEVKLRSTNPEETRAHADTFPPAETLLRFPRNPMRSTHFDFGRWYGAGIDSITFACQRQIERFLLKQDGEIEVSTIVTYCRNGLRRFLDYLILRASSLGTELSLSDIDRGLIDGFLRYVADRGTATTHQKNCYSATRAVLLALGRRSQFRLVEGGASATFPTNPFPNVNRKYRGETALTRSQRNAFTAAVKTAVMPLWSDGVEVTSDLLAYAMLVVALHTGRNTTPLLEMDRDCFRAHPKDATVFLVLWKRRSRSFSKVTLRGSSQTIDSTPTVKTNVERLIRRVMELTAPLQEVAREEIRERVWLYRSKQPGNVGTVVELTESTLQFAIAKLVATYDLRDKDGTPLRINVSRLRKTFGNRIFELLDGDLATTAVALGNSPRVAGRSYLAPDEDSRRNWRFMGQVLVKELLSRTIGATYRTTPMGGCSDSKQGQFAPKKRGAECFTFLNCLRCKNYVVTGDDLYRLFSFYYRVLAERNRLSRKRWERDYAHIPRLIDDYIVAEGLKRKVFKEGAVESARAHARRSPHPFWSYDALPSLEVFS